MTGLVKKLLFCGAKSLATTELPEGRIWVCVGRDEKAQRFELEANYLNHPLFEDLLRLSAPEFGYSYEGALRIACETDLFLHLLDLLRSSNPSVHYMELRDLMDKFHASAGAGGHHDKPRHHHHH
ncbi:auxin-induced protein X10A [Phoenix dactylifera]|uniref:Auxin-induced protein X10A n=1 Tax=Phoenix dactylifera TaxID=42345 RepID=A0A8B7CCS2_PHODC|nr:auxin-induced protein X10A [Phoenix dactylifera]